MARVIDPDIFAALNIWMEARGEPYQGKVAVAEVMRTRLRSKRWGPTIFNVVLAPYQFSGWNTSDKNRIAALQLDTDNPTLQECLKAWGESAQTNITKGAVLYCNPKVLAKLPAWATPANLLAEVGNHKFYKE